MNRRILLIAVACMCFATICRAQTEDIKLPVLKGTWKLDSVIIKQITSDGDTVSVPYSQDTYQNSSDCIFPVLKIEEKQCVFKAESDMEYVLDYTINDSAFTLWYTAPVIFEYTKSGNRLSLSRQYSKLDSDNQIISLSINLTYIKDENK
jgi:hypothetical protein